MEPTEKKGDAPNLRCLICHPSNYNITSKKLEKLDQAPPTDHSHTNLIEQTRKRAELKEHQRQKRMKAFETM
jgi:hypothetical protein